jgi:hypothetical protein
MLPHGEHMVILSAGAAIVLYLVIYLALYVGIVLYPHARSVPRSAAGAATLAGLIWAFLLVSYYLTDLLIVVSCVVYGVAIWLVFRAERLRASSAG